MVSTTTPCRWLGTGLGAAPALPITVVPGVEHFFHGRLPLLKALALRHLAASPPLNFEREGISFVV